MSHHPNMEEEEFPEPEYSDAAEVEEEEEVAPELVVIDDEFVNSLSTEVLSGNPVKLAQAVDVILGALELKDNIIFDDEHTVNPLSTLLVPLVTKVNELYETSIGKNASKRKATEKMLTDIVQVFDLFDKFKGKEELLHSYLETVYVTRNFVDKDDVSKALTKVAALGTAKANAALDEYCTKFVADPKFAAMIYKLRYIAFTNAVGMSHDAAIEKMLEPLIDFYMINVDKSRSYVKSIIMSFSDRLAKSMAKLDKNITTWETIAMVNFLTDFTIRTETNCFVLPVLTDFMALLRNFDYTHCLPFQIRVAAAAIKLSDSFGKVVPIASWAADAIESICNFKCKAGTKFDWDTELEVPQNASYEFAEEAIDKLSRIIMQQLKGISENIAFPEYSESIRRKLQSVIERGSNDRLRLKPKSIVKTITDQQNALVSIKRGLNWNTRGEQIKGWQTAVATTKTPIKESEERQKAVEAIVAASRAKASAEQKEVVDEAGDTLKVVTPDNFMD